MEFQGSTKEYVGCILLLAALGGAALGGAVIYAVNEVRKMLSYSPSRSIGLAAGEGFAQGWDEAMRKR